MRVQKKTKAFANRVPIGDYNYLQCMIPQIELFLFVFLEELRIPKSPFEINWSLIGTTVKKGVFAEQVFVLGEQLNCL